MSGQSPEAKTLQGLGLLLALVSAVLFLIAAALLIGSVWTSGPARQSMFDTALVVAVVSTVFCLGSVGSLTAARRRG